MIATPLPMRASTVRNCTIVANRPIRGGSPPRSVSSTTGVAPSVGMELVDARPGVASRNSCRRWASASAGSGSSTSTSEARPAPTIWIQNADCTEPR